MSLFLDIETDFFGQITVVGFYSDQTGFQQLVGEQVTKLRLMRRLPKPVIPGNPGRRELITFNGHCFDLPVIRKRLGLDLRSDYDSRDLRFICKKHGLTGGQKTIEKILGLKRELPDMDGRDALYLWQNYTDQDDRDSLDILLAYNREDVMNLVRIYEKIASL